MSRMYYLHLITELELGSDLANRRDRNERDELDPEECFTEIDGQIMCWEEDGEPLEVGRVKATLIDLDRTADAWETLDSRSSELEGLYRHVFGRYAGVMRPAVAKVYDEDGNTDMFFDPVLYVEKVEVSVAHRGRGVGLLAMDALLTHFCPHATLAFCKPFPLHRLQRSGSGSQEPPDPRYYDPNLSKISIASGTSALRRYWAKAGFVKLGRGPYFVVNLKKKVTRNDRSNAEDRTLDPALSVSTATRTTCSALKGDSANRKSPI
jgi:hypothetical protein